MKRQICLLVCVLLLFALMLVACDNGTDSGDPNPPAGNTHQHVYGDVWSMDETNHWHAATCKDGADCAAAKASLNAHADADKNSVCDVCGYDYNHTHTYATEWSSDENGHWYDPTCDCEIEGKDPAAHKDADNDGACDVCEYDGGHEHTFVTDAWAMDADKHWHMSSCGHSVIEEEEAHDYDDMDRCYVCGYIKGGVTVDKAVDMGEYYDNLVNGGHVDFEYDTWTKYQLAIDYALGANSSHISENNLTYAEKTEFWYLLYNGAMFGIEEYADGSVGKSYEPASALIDGYAFAQVFGDDDDAEDTFYGVTALITGLYELAKTNPNGDFNEYIVSYEGTPYYVFSFSRPMAYGDTVDTLYQVQVGFALGEDFTYRHVYVSSAKYNCEADESGSAYHTTNLVPNTVYNYVVEQTSGKRELESKYTPDNIFLTDYVLFEKTGSEDVFDENGEWIGTKPILSTTPLGDEITFEAGKTFSMCFAQILPDTAILDLDNVTIEYSGGDSSYWGGSVMLFSSPQGTYTLTIKTALTTKTLTVIVTAPEVTEIYPTVSENGVFADKSEHTVYVDENGSATITFSAGVNDYADSSFTAVLPADAQGATLTDNGDGTYTLNATATGTWIVTMTSKSNPAVSCTLTLTAAELPQYNVADVLKGKYQVTFFGTPLYEFTFRPLAADGLAGTLTVVDNNNTGWSGTFDFIYETGTLTYSNADGVVDIPFRLDAATGTFLWNNNTNFAVVHTEEEPPAVGEPLDGKYQVNFLMDGLYVLTFENGTLTVEDYSSGAYNGVYTYTGTPASGMVIYNADGSESDMIIALGMDGNPTFQCAGLMMPQTLVKVEENVEDPEEFDGKYSVDFLMEGLYVLTFENGTLTIEDNNNGAYTGTYTYTGTPEAGMIVYNADGTESDIFISLGLDGNPTFQCGGLVMAQPLNKVEEGGEEEDPQSGLILGNNSIRVEDTWMGAIVDFTAPFAGSYTLSAAAGESNAFIMIETMYGSELIDLPYTFELGEGETITFIVLPANYNPDTIDLVLTMEGGDEPVDNTLVMGENSVYVKVENFWAQWTEMVFTAPYGATFQLSLAAGEENADIYDFNGEWIEYLPYTFTLEEGESITFYFASLNLEIAGDYIDVVISEAGNTPDGPDVPDEPSDFNGTYKVNLLMDGLYVLTFENGTLTIEDNNNGAYTGTYTYTGTPEAGMIVYNADGSESDIVISVGMDGNPTFQCGGMVMPQPLVPAEGGDEPDVPDEPAGNVLVMGENSVYVQVINFWPQWTEMVFTAPYGATFQLSLAAGEENADIYDFNGEWIENLPYTFTLEEGESITFFFASLELAITDDYIDVVISEADDTPDVPDDPDIPDEPSDFNGTYNVNFLMDGLYVLTFENGTLTIEDNNNGAYTGTYTYTGTPEAGMIVYNADGSESDIVISVGMDGNPTFQCGGMVMPQPLVPAEGGDEPDVPDEPVGNVLVMGENSVYVQVINFWPQWTEMVFTAPYGATFQLSLAAGEENADIYDFNGEWIENLPYTFTLEEGESITFFFASLDLAITDDYIDVVIFEGSAGGDEPDEPGDELPDEQLEQTLYTGENSVRVTVTNFLQDKTKASFAAPWAGTFTLSLAAGEENGVIFDADGNEITVPVTFTLEAGETVIFWIQTADFMLEEDYIDLVIAEGDAPAEDPGVLLVPGENVVYVTVTYGFQDMIKATFTAPVAGTYTISWAEGEENGWLNDANMEWIENVPYTFYLEADESIVFYFQSIDYMITEDYLEVVIVGEEDKPDEGDKQALSGEYRVDFYGTTYYTLIFNNGVLTLTDNNSEEYTGTYTYTEAADGSVSVYRDGVSAEDILISVAPDGSYTFQCPPLKIAQPLVKYVLPSEDNTETVNKLSLGENAIKVTNGWKGTSIPFTAPSTGKYALAPAVGETNAVIIIEDGNVTELIHLNSPYEFYLEEGQTKVFIVATQNYNADTINLVLTAVSE